jgi:uncharacterized integral membrane protein (TIGR00698 family)
MSPALALAAGVLVALIIGNPWPQLTATLGSRLLQVAVVALGFGMSLDALIRAGSTGVALTVLLIAAILAFGVMLGRWMAVERDVSLLVTAGTSICGGSAVAALGSAIGASRESMSVAVATVFVLNAIALYVFPPIGHWLDLSQHQFGVWAALAIHDTSSVVGAAASYGPDALQEATILKLARALWILPMVLLVPRLRRQSHGASKTSIAIPWFIGLFVLAAVARSFATPGTIRWFDAAAHAGRMALAVTLFLIGAGLSRQQLRVVGPRPLLHGLVLWIVVSSATLAGVVLLLPR